MAETNGVFLDLIIKGTKEAKQEAQEMEKSIQNTQKQIAKMTVTLRNMISTINKLTGYTDDYITSVKLLKTTFGEASGEAMQFTSKMSEMIGIDEATLNRKVSLFKQIGESLNLSSEYSVKFSEALTDLSAKLSILYNKDFNVMATSLQRAVQGTQETLKAMTGIEATELSQQFILTSNGINRTVASLNEAERSIVMYASILSKVTSDNKAYEESVNSVAWQKQMLIAQVKRLGNALGSILYPILQKILPVLNAILMVLTEIITFFAKLMGITISATSGTNQAADSYNNLASGISAAGAAAKKQLRGFDKLNNITTPSGGGGAGGALGIDESILALLDKTSSKFLDIKNKATEIRDKIMEWLGFTKIVNEETGEVSWILNEGYTNIEKIRDALIVIGTVWAGLKFASVLTKAISWFTKLSKVLGNVKGATGVVGAISSLGGSIMTAFGITGAGAITTFIAGLGGVLVAIAGVYAAVRLLVLAFQDSVKEADLLEGTSVKTRARLEPVQEAFKDLRSTLSTISYDNLALTEEEKTKIIESINALTDSMKTALNDYVASQLESANHLYYELGVITEEEYQEQLKEITKFKKESLDKIEKYGKELNSTYETIYDENGNIIQRNYNEFLSKQASFETDFLASLAQTSEDSDRIIKNSVDFSKSYTLKGAEEQLQNAKKAKEDRIKVLEEERTKSLEEVDTLFKEDEAKREEHRKKVNEKYDELVGEAEEAYHDIYNEMVVANEDIARYISEDKAKIKPLWQNLWTNLTDAMKTSISKIRSFWDNLKFNSKKVEVTASTTGPITTYSVGGFADGGFPTEGELFMAREAGPELVGKINGRTAVANNDQITDGIRQATYQGMMSALSTADFGSNITIEATGDDSGLLDFISFRQKQKDRQYN